jgi:hypothetical protein
MRRNLIVFFSLLALASTALASGETASGTLTISATLAGSITLSIGGGNAGATTGGTIALGTVSKYGTYTPPAGFARSNNAVGTSPWRIGGGTWTVTVNQANVDTPANGFALTSSIGSASGTGITWTEGVTGSDTPVSSSIDLSNGSAHDIFTSGGTAGTYGTASTHTLNIDITDAAAPASVNPLTRTITFTATAN